MDRSWLIWLLLSLPVSLLRLALVCFCRDKRAEQLFEAMKIVANLEHRLESGKKDNFKFL